MSLAVDLCVTGGPGMVAMHYISEILCIFLEAHPPTPIFRELWGETLEYPEEARLIRWIDGKSIGGLPGLICGLSSAAAAG